MDRAEIGRRVERAEKLLQKGKTADALEEYLQVLAGDPENDTVRQMGADLCLSLQRIPEAVRLLGELFDRQIEAGDATRASLTYKKLSRFVNPNWEQKVRFGQLLENSNRKLALDTYENAFEELVKQNRKADAFLVLKLIVALDSSKRNLMRLGELSSEMGDNKGAAAAFLKLAGMAVASGTSASPWFERAYAEDSSDMQIALAYGKSLLEQGQAGAAIFVLEQHVKTGQPSAELRDTYTKSLIAAHRLSEAEPLLWQIFEQNPTRFQEVADLIGLLVDAEQDAEAVALARKLEQFQRRKGERRSFVALMQDLAARHRTSPEMLEFMSELFNSSNREGDYCQTLLKLFDLHVGMGNFAKAAECLDRAAEVDPYEIGHQKRLDSLKGKIDDSRFKVISSRFQSASTNKTPEPATTTTTARAQEPMLGASALQDLMLQAEILVQYGMRSKAIERMQRIQELFPNEEERNQDLQRLYIAVGMTPHRGGSEPPPAPRGAGVSAAGPVAVDQSSASAAASDAADVSSLTKVSEITRTLYRQTNADSVMTTAVNEIGEHWKVSRCVVAMRKPGLPPSSMKEFHAEEIGPSDPAALAKIVAITQDLAIVRGTLTLTDAPAAQEMQPVQEAMASIGVTSLLALPLNDGSDQVGVLLLIHGSPRGWRSSDIVVLKTLSEHVVIALNNAGLRRLVKNLSVTDEQSGLLKRASYLDLLMAETRRALQQATPLTVALLQFGRSAGLVKEFGEVAVETIIKQIGQLFASHVRQNDLVFRYEITTIALVLGETTEKEASLAMEKLRKLLAEVKFPEKDTPVSFNAGIAEAVVRPGFDPVDVVTEVINRAELALDTSIAQGNGKVLALSASMVTAAVA